VRDEIYRELFLGLDREVSRPPVNNFSRSAEGPLKEAVMGSLLVISEESSVQFSSVQFSSVQFRTELN